MNDREQQAIETAADNCEIRAALAQQLEPTDTFTAHDMATAAAQGFRDGQKVEPARAQKGAADGWTNEKPAMEGAYWIRGNDPDVPALIQVKMGPDELECNLHIRTTETDFWYGYTIAHLSDEFEWLGPLHPANEAEPAPAQDEQGIIGVERYRVEPTGRGFWPFCVRAGDGERELFIGHRKTCEQVAAELATAFEDGKFVATRPAQTEQQPLAWLIDWPEEPELGHYFSDEPNEHARSRPLYAAPIKQTAPVPDVKEKL